VDEHVARPDATGVALEPVEGLVLVLLVPLLDLGFEVVLELLGVVGVLEQVGDLFAFLRRQPHFLEQQVELFGLQVVWVVRNVPVHVELVFQLQNDLVGLQLGILVVEVLEFELVLDIHRLYPVRHKRVVHDCIYQ